MTHKNPLSRLTQGIGSVFSAIFGKIHWTSPSWMLQLRQKAKQSPLLFFSILFLFAGTVCAGIYGYHWYNNQPKPVYVTAAITSPDVTPNEETLVPGNLTINFKKNDNEFALQSVAPLALVGKTVTEGVTLDPAMPGEWRWNSDSQLVFSPAEDWPANQRYTITFAENFFTPATQMERHDFSFTTLPFKASISEFRFYQDPVNSEQRSAEATIRFNFPVDTASLEKNTSLIFEALKNDSLNLAEEPLSFTYTYDTNKREAYFHSSNIKIKQVARFLLLTLGKEVHSASGSGTLDENMSAKLMIPDASNFLRISNASANIVRNDKDRPEQVLAIESTLGVNESEFNKSVHLYLLPKDYPATAFSRAKPDYYWQNPGEVTADILALSRLLPKEALPAEQNYATLHSFKFATQTPAYIYVKIDKGMKGFGGFTLSKDYTAIIPAPQYPKEITFLHKGSLLALSDEKKLSVLVRGVPAVKFDFARVLPENVNQLVTQTQGDFNNPYFINPSFNQQNISQISSEIEPFYSTDMTQQQYTALDLGKYFKPTPNATGPQGLFLIKATGWDRQTQSALDVNASRLVLLTDLGLIVKDNHDGTHEVFVSSITSGAPVGGVDVAVLGKNGLPIISRGTDEQGKASFPALNNFVEDREPVAYIARINDDVSFIPYNNYNRQLNFSKFDVGGLYTNSQDPHNLSAYLFSDRGIYRPGDTAHIGMIVKQAYAQEQPAGLPLQIRVMDARGSTIKDEKISLDDSGYMEIDFSTTATSPTGQYTVDVFLVKDDHAQNLLGSTTVTVSEFQPDRMRISASLQPKPVDGWISPSDLKANVELWNLYGAPAADRKISAKLLLTPQQVAFDQFPDYVFADPLFDPKKPPKTFTDNLTETKTNDKGLATFDLHLERFEKATYQLTFFAEGFEAEGGRSVTTQTKALISPLPYLVGYKTDGDLAFIKQNSARSVQFIAINPQLTQEVLNDLTIQLVSLHPVTTLVKKPDGTYQYQSVIQSSVVNTNPLLIKEQGTDFSLPTDQIGDFALQVLDKNKTIVSQLQFTVVGASQQPLAKNAQLSVKLNKDEYFPNEDIEIQITAPYTGSGLITIERDKVYAVQWFKSDTTNSLQTIRVPADFKGDGYINVAFIRDWESPELFVSPLSYSIAPFSVNHDNQDIKIDLTAAKLVRPGEDLTIDYHTDRPAKIIVFAVDEGILQVARYDTPDPLAYFFQKHALEVLTQQTVDQILPKFIQDREWSAAGGDDGEAALAGRLNPFKRKTDLPVVYWSGILDANTGNNHLTYHVPDYFNGTIRLMAVAVAADALGSQETSTQVRGDFIINPNVPTFVAPGDEFEISASIANNVKFSGDHAQVTVNLSASPEIKIIGSMQQTLEIAEGHEQTVRFKLRATSSLGAAKVSFEVQTNNKSAQRDATLSVRPASPYITRIDSGQTLSAQTLDVEQTLFPQHRSVIANVSTSPLILIFGLQRYLDEYPYGCTEQLTSKALPLLAMSSQPWFDADKKEISERVDATVSMLSQRQMSSGGFSYWPGLGANESNNFASVYAMHFLTEARAAGFNVPNEMFFNGISYLKQLAGENVSNMDDARTQAYAIYLLTRNELVTSNYLANLQSFLQKDSKNTWKTEIVGAYIAASLQLMKSNDEAYQLINQYKPQGTQAPDSSFYDTESADAQYFYLVAKHFPALLPKAEKQVFNQLINALNNQEISTIVSGYTSMALAAYPSADSVNTSSLSITTVLTNNQEKTIAAEQGNYQQLKLAPEVKKVRFNNPDKTPLFYQLIQSGFDNNIPSEPTAKGMEIVREYKDEKGSVVDSVTLGNEIEVHIQIRALDNSYLSHIAIEDLLPGGFEVVQDSVKANMEYFDVREDRVNFFGSISSNAQELVYKIKATNPGTYLVPPVYAEAMYNPTVRANGTAAKITVTP